ncbi:MAG TPA: hypothetical protein VLG10_05840 [Methylomirabilota bacterium]|nr:hypothetical protein [Methylomirabilota bacterium]
MRRVRQGWQSAGVVAFMAALIIVGPGIGQAQDKGPNTGRVSLGMGVDFTTHYFFRGILQEDQDYIVQPYGEVTFKLLEGEGAFTGLGFTLGLWNSLHGGPTGTGGANQDPRIWYEADFYAKVTATLFEDLTAAMIYTAYMSPNGRFTTVEELAFGFGYNDSKLLGPFALNPSVLIAFELDGQADGGLDEGVYLQIGLTPGYTFNEKGTYPLTVSLPVVLGLSLSDYYERVGVGGEDDTFGFLSIGLGASVPLKFVPASYGAWSAKASLTYITLGDNLKAANNRESSEVIGTFGLAMTY